ncbi:GPP34 family phosphoprotein [Streptomyces sp. NPDC005574]|uniref:GOLPH3/VPS74 family protein n=1 Tax=Streptomyces sp. NPDC005574 TaxID=3156891 RepID=UPI00339F687D
MTTARDLLIVAMQTAPDRPVEPGDLSLALAGAELIDLLENGSLTLDGDRIVPGLQVSTGDELLDQAAAALVRQDPYESAEDWLWRRGRGLSLTYLAGLEKDGVVTRSKGRWIPVATRRRELADSPARRHAEARRAADEPVLAALTTSLRMDDKRADDFENLTDEAVVTVLAAVGEAVTELESVRQRRTIEDAAFDNVWRGQ